jgi:hypothetical protein
MLSYIWPLVYCKIIIIQEINGSQPNEWRIAVRH